MQRRKTKPVHIPSATYRLQLNHLFPFEKARDIVAYLDELGFSDVYASPFLMARARQPARLRRHRSFAIQSGNWRQESFLELASELQRHGMGLVVDVVPNHMCITHPSNVWWWDVLENGPSSPFARYFDIDWHPPKEELTNKVLLPVLGDQFGRVFENQEIQALYTEGAIQVSVYESAASAGAADLDDDPGTCAGEAARQVGSRAPACRGT